MSKSDKQQPKHPTSGGVYRRLPGGELEQISKPTAPPKSKAERSADATAAADTRAAKPAPASEPKSVRSVS